MCADDTEFSELVGGGSRQSYLLVERLSLSGREGVSGKGTRCQSGAEPLTSQVRKATLRLRVAVFRPPKVLYLARQRYATKKRPQKCTFMFLHA